MEGGDTMSDPIQLSENLTVLWEGDVEGYAPAIELWNRVMVALVGELGALGSADKIVRLNPDRLQTDLPALMRAAFENVGAPSVQAPQSRSPLVIELQAAFGRLLVGVSVGNVDPSPDEWRLALGNTSLLMLRVPFEGMRCALNVAQILGAPHPSQQRPIQPHRGADVTMTAWWRVHGLPILKIGLRMGLHAKSARLDALKLVNTGPAEELALDPFGPRMNLITGDNGLGKSFFLENLWFMLTGHWHNFPAIVNNVDKTAFLTARLREGARTEVRQSLWRRQEQGWASPREHTADTEKMGFYTDLSFTDFNYLEASPEGPAQIDAGLVVYARVDGSFSVWDSHRNVQDTVLRGGVTLPAPRVFAFSYRDVMHGLKVWLDDKNEREVSLGLINEWREWQLAKKPQFELLKKILAALGPGDESLTPGEPRRPYLDDAKDIPTIQMGYGQEVPITLAPAGVKRAAMLAYVLTWAISEHRRLVDARASLPARSVVLLIDEPETHLHPRWQRTILPSLLKALEVGFGEPKVDVQMFVATHSPLVLASLEPHFDPALDALWKLDLVDGEVKLERDVWHKRGDANAWLTSDVFDMSSSRSVEAEKALKRAKALALRGTATAEEIAEVQAELARSLTDTDRAWRAWESFVEHLETQR